jgi:hypothetical protein
MDKVELTFEQTAALLAGLIGQVAMSHRDRKYHCDGTPEVAAPAILGSPEATVDNLGRWS